MKVTKIIANRESIEFSIDSATEASATVVCYSPAIGENTEICRSTAVYTDGVFSIKRFLDGYDLLCSRFVLTDAAGNACEGKQYVENITFSERTFDYPVAETKKGLQVWMIDDAIELGVKHVANNANLGNFIMPNYVEGNTIEFNYDGKTYFINKASTQRMDARLTEFYNAGMIVTLILLNSKDWAGMSVEDDFWEVIKHPAYEGKIGGKGLISQFNIVTDKGVEYYKAFVAFLTERYTRDDAKYGRAVGFIVANEVNSASVWCNSGIMSCEEFTRHYCKAVRLTYQVAASFYKNIRVYVSLDHFWTAAHSKNDYGAKYILENMNKEYLAEGQVPWNVAHHPYPESLAFPDFWNDKTATDDVDTTKRITFKNLELLAQFLYRDEMLCNGERRRIILSEQGFNSHWTPESEVLQAMAYGRAYKKIMQIPEIDSFILHAHGDNMHEFSLNLGLWRRYRDRQELESPKPIYYVFKAIDKKDEKGVYHWERY
ncbi:MAG: hypothetical protein IJY39_03735 [Clostridia bacterium]|nr:hypothetical protein [Clostridia bacterium]